MASYIWGIVGSPLSKLSRCPRVSWSIPPLRRSSPSLWSLSSSQLSSFLHLTQGKFQAGITHVEVEMLQGAGKDMGGWQGQRRFCHLRLPPIRGFLVMVEAWNFYLMASNVLWVFYVMLRSIAAAVRLVSLSFLSVRSLNLAALSTKFWV